MVSAFITVPSHHWCYTIKPPSCNIVEPWNYGVFISPSLLYCEFSRATLENTEFSNSLRRNPSVSAMAPKSLAESDAREIRTMNHELMKCDEFAIPDGYKMKLCRFCRTPSWAKSPLALSMFASWQPLIPWNQGRKEKPAGTVCRICALESRYCFNKCFFWESDSRCLLSKVFTVVEASTQSQLIQGVYCRQVGRRLQSQRSDRI